jgi:hypothetical protein
MAIQTWALELDGRSHRIQLVHSYWSGKNVLSIDNVVAVRDTPGFAGLSEHCFGLTELVTRLRGHELRVLISPSDSFELVVDGHSTSSGELVPALPRPPHDAFDRLGNLGAITAIVTLPLIFIVTFLFGRFSPEWGPRWFAANDLVLACGLVPFMAGFGIWIINLARRPASLGSRAFAGVIGLACLWVAAVGALEIPAGIADVIGDPDTVTLTVVESATQPSNAPTIRTSDGATYEWVWAFGLYDYPKVGAGTYQVVLTPARHRIVAIHRVP